MTASFSKSMRSKPCRSVEEVEYGGVRVRTTATIAGARIPIQVDIGFGDAVTPGPVDIEYPVVARCAGAAPSSLSRRNRHRREI
ncbi:nucleotidyl transferase AbiEii/AbiGii toxin family protein [Rhizobium yanglingense]